MSVCDSSLARSRCEAVVDGAPSRSAVGRSSALRTGPTSASQSRVYSLGIASLRDTPEASEPSGAPASPDAARAPRHHVRLLRGAAKRGSDLLVSTVTLLCLTPLLVLVAVAIKLDSPGPVMFRQRRVGRDGREFTMVKFRSMSEDATHEVHHQYVAALAAGPVDPTSGDLLKLTDDPRVTRVGAKIRKASIDELPQLFNVLAGQMSIVGPRPAVHYELDLYRPEHLARFTVRPGITGLWQVSGRNRLGFNEMLDLDVEYARRQSFGLDLSIMLRTPLAVLRAHTA